MEIMKENVSGCFFLNTV